MTTVEAAAKFQVDRRTIINWIAEGRLTAHKVLDARKTNAWNITGSAIAWMDQALTGKQLPSSAPIHYRGVSSAAQVEPRTPIPQPPTTAEQPPPPPIRYVPIDDAGDSLEAQRRAIHDAATSIDRPPIRPNPISKLRST